MKKNIFLLLLIILIYGCTSHKETPLADGILTPGLYSDYITGGDIYVLDDFNTKVSNYTIFDDSTQNPAGNSTGFSNILSKSTTDKYLYFEYYLGPDCPWRYVGIKKVNINMDVSKYDGIALDIKGSGNKLRINLNTAGVSDWDFHGYNIEATPNEWRRYVIPFSEFKRAGFGTGDDQYLDLKNLKEIEFKADSGISGEEGWFAIDNIEFIEKITTRD